MSKSKRDYLYQRENSGIYYAQIRNPNTRKRLTARSTRSHNKDEAATGARAEEVRGLLVEDIGENRIFIRHALSKTEGLKALKFGKNRVVPIPSH